MSKKSLISIGLLFLLAIGMVGCYSSYNVNTLPDPMAQQGSATTAQTPFPAEGVINGIEYSINDGSGYFQINGKVGYYIDTLDEPNAPYFIFITTGEKALEKYSVVVRNIEVDTNNNLTVTVEFVNSDTVTENAYPTVNVSVKPFPASIKVQTVAGLELECLG